MTKNPSTPPSHRPLGVCVLAINSMGQPVLVNRPGRDDHFCLPGGKTEPGETALGAAVRELREETGLRAAEEDLVEWFRGECEGGDDGVAYDVTAFLLAPSVDAIPGSEEEHLQARWGSVEDLLERSPFHRFNRRALRQVVGEIDLLTAWMELPAQDRRGLERLRYALVEQLGQD